MQVNKSGMRIYIKEPTENPAHKGVDGKIS